MISWHLKNLMKDSHHDGGIDLTYIDLHFFSEKSSGGRVMTFIKTYPTANYSKCKAYLLTNKARISNYEYIGRGKSILK